MQLGRILSNVSQGHRGFGPDEHYTPHLGGPAGVHDIPTYVPVATLGQSIREPRATQSRENQSRTTLLALGGCQSLAHGRTRLCGLTPGQAPPTSHQDPSCSHQAQVLCVCTRLPWARQHQTLHSRVVNCNGPPKGLTKGFWSPVYTWLSRSLFL